MDGALGWSALVFKVVEVCPNRARKGREAGLKVFLLLDRSSSLLPQQQEETKRLKRPRYGTVGGMEGLGYPTRSKREGGGKDHKGEREEKKRDFHKLM